VGPAEIDGRDGRARLVRRNAEGAEDISASGAAARTLVVEAREDLEIARGVRAVLR
jgi:hypothetical protein